MAATTVERKARILESYTFCDGDCEDGYHNPRYTLCDRCGAQIHVRVYVVETAAGEELTVGSECLRDVLGYVPGPWHQRAEQVAAKLRKLDWVKPGCRIRVYGTSGKAAVVDMGSISYLVTLPHRLSLTLLRAGADLGVWTYPWEEKARDVRGTYWWVEWIG